MLSKTIKSLFLFVAFFCVLQLEARDFYLQLEDEKFKITEDGFNLAWLFKDAYDTTKDELDENEPFVVKLDVHFDALLRKGIIFPDIIHLAELLDEKLDLKSITRKNFDKLIILADFFSATDRKDIDFHPERDILKLLTKKRIEYAGVKDYEAFAKGEGILFYLSKKGIKVKADWFVKLKHKGSPFYPNPMFLENRMWAERDRGRDGNKIKIGRLVLDGENIAVKFETLPFDFSTKKTRLFVSNWWSPIESEKIISVVLLPDGKIAILKKIKKEGYTNKFVEVWKPTSREGFYELQWNESSWMFYMKHLVSLKYGRLALSGSRAVIYRPYKKAYEIEKKIAMAELRYSRFLSKENDYFITSKSFGAFVPDGGYKEFKKFSHRVLHAYGLPIESFITLEEDEEGSVDLKVYSNFGRELIIEKKEGKPLKPWYLSRDSKHFPDMPKGFYIYPFMSYDGIVYRASFDDHSHISSLMIPLMSVIPYKVLTFEQSMFIQWLWRASLTQERNPEKPKAFEKIQIYEDSLEERILLDTRLRRILLSFSSKILRTIREMQWLTFSDKDWDRLEYLTPEGKKKIEEMEKERKKEMIKRKLKL